MLCLCTICLLLLCYFIYSEEMKHQKQLFLARKRELRTVLKDFESAFMGLHGRYIYIYIYIYIIYQHNLLSVTASIHVQNVIYIFAQINWS